MPLANIGVVHGLLAALVAGFIIGIIKVLASSGLGTGPENPDEIPEAIPEEEIPTAEVVTESPKANRGQPDLPPPRPEPPNEGVAPIKPNRTWGILACILAWLFAVGGFCSLYGFLYSSTHGQLTPVSKDPTELLGLMCGGMMFWGLGLAFGLTAALRSRVVAAWPAAALCGLWMVLSVVQYMLRAAK